jgi:glycosyltransferase involved in cell wall biosynthesis
MAVAGLEPSQQHQSALSGAASPDVICLASQCWDSHWATPQQTCTRLARQGRVLYVEPLRSPLWALRRASTQSNRPAGELAPVATNLWVLNLPPVFVPLELYRRLPLLRSLNSWLMSLLVRRAARQLGLNKPVVWAYLITHAGAPLWRAAEVSVYDCIDEWAGCTNDAGLKRYFTALDRQMCSEADVLFLGSSALAAQRSALNERHRLVPQGVDLQHFLPPDDGKLPEDLAHLPGPVIGLVGVLNRERIDIDLLCQMAASRPDWSIVLVGPVWDGLDTARLDRHPNIHRLGNRPRETLGRYLAGFDVCMLPYLINDFTRNIFPLKLFEYLAAGKPFVSTPVPACMEFEDMIRIAEGPDAFVAAVEAAMAEDTPALRERRITLARQNDWDRRVADKLGLVNEVRAFTTDAALATQGAS